MERILDEVWSDRGLEGKYLFEQHIATSSMAVVVAARHLELDERVAIKFLSPDAMRSNTAVSRFRSEAKAAAKIKSQHVVRIIDVATTANNIPYIVMEYLDGKDLERLLGEFADRRAPILDAVDFVLQASEAVCEGHALGIVHRDLKPANLFCVDRGDGYPQIKVLDFGISKFTSTQSAVARTDRHEILGSPRYMSPEQIESASTVDPRTDIWSLGVILYEALAGIPPFDDERILGLWRKIKEVEPVPVPSLRVDCPSELWSAVARCLAKDPVDRFVDLGELTRALAPFAPDRSRSCIGRILWLTENNKSSTIKSSLFTDAYDRVTTNPPRRGHRWMVAGGIATSLGLGLGIFVARGGQPRSLTPALAMNALIKPKVTAPLLNPTASATASPIVPSPSYVEHDEPLRRIDANAPSASAKEPPGSTAATKPPKSTKPVLDTSKRSKSEEQAEKTPIPVESSQAPSDAKPPPPFLMPPQEDR